MTDAVSAAARSLSVAEAMERGEDIEKAVSFAGRMFRKTIADILRDRMKALESDGLMREMPDISALEMANAGTRCRKADPEAFGSILGAIRERLAEDSFTEEDEALIWLLREAGVLPFMLTPGELELVGKSEALGAFPLWSVMFGKKLELGNVKRKEGVIPRAEDRTSGAFIEGIFLQGGDRRSALMGLLCEREHEAETVEEGDRPLIRIDGNLYRADMHARKTGRLAIEGISLRPACR